ncbi:hypothetical protein GWI33_017200 [Rhynchophorus ferrugineus]|uniref:Ion transport domain-containing protein n=1 Tax=Rhynchophorus ferrugineus TaxID=354439 RepID=A0A834HYL1_RHYFE|nr:hypothetical protein GWI33_017200 [Rhynchophorus ferrugineus]
MDNKADLTTIDIDETSSDISSEGSLDHVENERKTVITPLQDLWNTEDILKDFQTYPNSEGLNELVMDNDTEAIMTKNKDVAFLIAAWTGRLKTMQLLYRDGVSVNVKDRVNRTALHFASYANQTSCVQFLLQNGASIGERAGEEALTPLHCAASMGNLDCLKLLIKFGANVNAGIEKRSPLHYAVQSMSVECVKELLDHKAIPNTPQVYSETPLHVAASIGNTDAVELLLNYGAAVNVQSGPDRLTPLHLAAEQGYMDCIKLLIEGRGMVNAANRKLQTPLHLAALNQCAETVELLLKNSGNPNFPDVDGRTPLHCSIVNVQKSLDLIRLLLSAGADPNRADIFGYTPLHLAALHEFPRCVMMLLEYGGDVTARTKGGISVLNFITKKTPEVIPKYILKFDNSIRLNEHDLGDVDCQLKLDFRILVPSMGNQETALLVNFIEVGYKDILEHPLCKTFLLLKWRIIRKFFLFTLLYHTIFVLLFSFYVVGVYLKYCPSFRRGQTATACMASEKIVHIGYCVLVFNFLIVLKELFQIFHNWKAYFKEWENWLQWVIIITVFLCVQPMDLSDIRKNVYNWQHHAAAISIFLTWLELMMIVGRFPAFGIYVQMFTTVALNFSKFMCAYFSLFVAFSLAFGVIFPNYPSFTDLKWVFIKVIIMMSGELEYEDVFFDDKYPIKYPYTAHFAYLGFVLLVTVILANLMVGLAVNDIQGLQKSAVLHRLVRQATLMAHLESLKENGLWILDLTILEKTKFQKVILRTFIS